MSLSRSLQYAFIAIIVTTVGFSLYQWNASRASTQKTAPNNGLVGYWSFDEGLGTQAGDASGNGNTGTLTNGPTWTTGKLGQAINFDGTDDYATMGDQSSLEINNNSLSFGGWFYINAYPAVSNRMFLISKGTSVNTYEYEMTVSGYSTNHLTASVFNTGGGNYLTVLSNTVPPLNTWFHVMAVYDKNAVSVKIYYNGVLENTSTTTTGVLHTTRVANFEIGRRNDNAEAKLNGKADEVRIYNRALSGTEITNLYNLGAAKLNTTPTASLTSGLVGYWTFDGKDTPWTSSSAGTATDRSGNSNTGTLTNMSRATSSVSGQIGQALNFDGVDDYVTTTNTTSLDNLFSSAVTFCAWAKFPNFTSYNRLITIENNAGTDYDVWIQTQQSSAIVQFGAGGTGKFKTSTTALSANTWYHLCGVTDYTAGGTKIFINGVEDAGSLGGTPTYTADKGYLDIGRLRATSSSLYGTGQIDEVRVYNRALSTTEIQSLYDLGASDKVNSSVSQNQGTGRLDSGLVGYWPLDDGSGTNANDASTNNNDGTLTGGPTWGTGRIGGDVVFDGVNDYIDLGNRSVLNLTNDFTVSQWVKINNITQSDYKRFFGRAQIDDNNRPFYTEYNHLTNKYSAVWRNGGTFGGNSGKTVTSTQWHHFVVTFKDGKSKSYSDGVLIESSSGVVQPPSSSSNTGIGDIFSGYYFPGSIDEVRVYNRVLSDDEVSQLYRLTTPTGVDTSLKGYWSFNGKDTNWTSSSAGTVADLSGSGNTGTMTNMSRATSSVSGKIGQALNFDGVDDYVNAGGSSNFTSSDFSISYWMKLNSLSTNVGGQGPVPIYKGQFNTNGYYAQIQQNGAVGFFTCQSGATQSTGTAAGTIVTGRWYHIVHTRGGSSVRNYVDGVDQTTGPATHINPTSSGSNFMIGRYGDSGTIIYTNGIIDEVRTYSRALSAPEITALYNSGR